VGFENKLIGQSNFPRQPTPQVSLTRGSSFLPAGSRTTPSKTPSRTAASAPEYAVNGVVYARRKAWPAAKAASPLVERRAVATKHLAAALGHRAKPIRQPCFRAISSFPQKFPGNAGGQMRVYRDQIATLDFESANPTIVKSIKQRDLLNT
jgi:hypothetical protein